MTHPPHARGRPIVVENGTRLGPYEILLCIARGGMASVWAARQHGARGFSRLVALKTILPELSAPDLDGMFLDEARVTARIHHPNVCEVFELIEHGGVLALSMEWVDGETLNNILAARPKEPALDARLAAQIIAHVASGLHAAHELRDERGAPLQIVHRDVSPQNILISRSGHVKITDFGVAKSLGAVREATAIGKIKGKLSYMSPEQAQGQALDRRSDIFSLGVVLYLATVGSQPLRRPGESRHQQIARLLTGRVKPPSELVKGYPKALEAIVLRALSRNPAQRYGTAEEMARRLQDWVVATGPLVTDQQIGQMVLQRVGSAIIDRSERIANLLSLHNEPTSDDVVPSPADPTLVPTTSRSGSVSPERARARATLRAVSTTLTAAAVGLAASFVFSTPLELPPGASAPPVFAPASGPSSPPIEPVPPSAALDARDAQSVPAIATAPSAPATESPSAALLPVPVGPVVAANLPLETEPTPPASPSPSPATSPALDEPASPPAPKVAAKSTRSTKARKPSPPKRKRRPVVDSYSIKRGR